MCLQFYEGHSSLTASIEILDPEDLWLISLPANVWDANSPTA